jgi:phosphoribosylformimino-5-aminoimidazole carboxamide ribotide isomerase
MKIYPAIDLMAGQAVRLEKGDFKKKTVYGEDPVAVALGFLKDGAEYLHIVDLDGAREQGSRQKAVISEIIKASHLAVQTGGGIRKPSDVADLLTAGAEKVVVGSLAVKDRDTVAAMIERFGPGKFVLALDVICDGDKSPRVAVAGWQEQTEILLTEMIREYLGFGIKDFLVTDIERDGMLSGPNFSLYEGILGEFSEVALQASGGIRDLDDLKRLKALGAAGTIIGKALYEGRLSLKEALQC